MALPTNSSIALSQGAVRGGFGELPRRDPRRSPSPPVTGINNEPQDNLPLFCNGAIAI
ncbi:MULTISPECIES: hypothetical protein [Oscillatoriales]|uniref:hypothetical protein n=1 Tax=Oscillatoriales TaxID=1150 RepID=UPI0002EEA2E2|nr:hypothetical protein [Limnospira sp. Paracas R14]